MDQTRFPRPGGTGNINSFNVADSYNHYQYYHETVNTTLIDQKPEILQWLSPLEPQKRHQYFRNSRLDGVGEWIFQTNEFREWHTRVDGTDHSVLFCYGDPGVGKSYLSSEVIDHFRRYRESAIVIGLYCDFLSKKEQTTPHMLGAMLKQLVGKGDIPLGISEVFENAKEHFGGVSPRVPELLEMLKTAIALRKRVIICIDALDEATAEHRASLLNALRHIIEELPNVQLFLTGRPFVAAEVMKYFPSMDTMKVSPKKDSILKYLRKKLENDLQPDAMDDKLSEDIMKIIPATMSKIFLLVSLNIESILEEATIAGRRKKLKEMTKGQSVGDLYAMTLERIKAQSGSRSQLGIKVLMWMSHLRRALNPDELCHALGIEFGTSELDRDNIPSLQTLLSSSLGLVTVDSSSSTVRLVHFTLQEYLLAHQTLFHNPHSLIAEVCLTYLNFQEVRDLSPTLNLTPPATPFLQYASCYWGAHARKETSERMITLALELLNDYDSHISSKLLFFHTENFWNWPLDEEGSPRGFTGLHGAAFLGIDSIIHAVLDIKEWDLNARDIKGNTALAWAAGKGHSMGVETLLKRRDVNPDMANYSGQTPLWLAAESGHEGVVKTLLKRSDVSPDKADTEYIQTPLLRAVLNQCEGVVKILLERKDVNPNPVELGYGLTPLSWAAQYGHEGIAEMLLDRDDVNPNVPDKGGRTPLSWAALNGHEGTVKMLLERMDVTLDLIDDEYGGTPLVLAAAYGEERIVEMLLARNDVNPNALDAQYGRTPLSWAAGNGHEGIVKLLLERGDLVPDIANYDGLTPLSWAAGNGHKGVVEALLEQNNINPDTFDIEYGRTPLSWAAGHGHKGVVKALLEQNNINPDTFDIKYGRTPLSWAAGNGHEGVVKVLLERSNVNPDAFDIEYGRTPLSWAAGNGYQGVVKLLLEREDVNPEIACYTGGTPLSWAASNRYEGVVAMLRERKGANPNTVNTDNVQKELLRAAENGHEDIVQVLLNRNDVNPNMSNSVGVTPLLLAAVNGHEGVVKVLLGRKDMNLNMSNSLGATPLSWAAVNGHEGIVEMLLGREDINPDMVNYGGRTPLSWAAANGHKGVVKMLLRREDINPDLANYSGRTALSWAAENGHEDIVKILLEQRDVNPNTVDTQYGRTPLSWATNNGYEGVVKILLDREDINPYATDISGGTALSYATMYRFDGVVQLLVDWMDHTPDSSFFEESAESSTESRRKRTRRF